MNRVDYKLFAGALRARLADGDHPDIAALRAAADAAERGARAGFLLRNLARIVAGRREYAPARLPAAPLYALAARERYLAAVRARLAAPDAPPAAVSVSELRWLRAAAAAAATRGGR